MKIAIITLIGTFNNGNRLQNYALQQTLKSIYPNATIETINLKEELSIKARIKKVLRFFLKPQKSKKQFNQFNKNITFSKKKYDLRKDKYKSIVDKYDYFVTGSDQVWNMGYYSNELYYFLDFVPSEKKAIICCKYRKQ